MTDLIEPDDIKNVFIDRFGQSAWDHHKDESGDAGIWFISECENIKRDLKAVCPTIVARALRKIAGPYYDLNDLTIAQMSVYESLTRAADRIENEN